MALQAQGGVRTITPGQWASERGGGGLQGLNAGVNWGALADQYRPQADQGMVDASGSAVGGPGQGYRDQIEGATFGRQGEVMNDPLLGQAQDFYTQTLQGGGPYDARVQNLISSQMTDQAGAGANAQQQQLQEQLGRRGMDMNDPSVQAEMRAIQNQQMMNVQGGQTNLAIQAALQNYMAQNQAAGSLGASRMGQLGHADMLGLQGANYVSQYVDEDPNNASQAIIPQYGQQQSGPVTQAYTPRPRLEGHPQVNMQPGVVTPQAPREPYVQPERRRPVMSQNIAGQGTRNVAGRQPTPAATPAQSAVDDYRSGMGSRFGAQPTGPGGK